MEKYSNEQRGALRLKRKMGEGSSVDGGSLKSRSNAMTSHLRQDIILYINESNHTENHVGDGSSEINSCLATHPIRSSSHLNNSNAVAVGAAVKNGGGVHGINVDEFTENFIQEQDFNQVELQTLHNESHASSGTKTNVRKIPTKADMLPLPIDCVYWGAKKFLREPKGFCFSNGSVELKNADESHELYYLFTSTSKEFVEFRTYIRTYNSNIAFTSFGVKYDKELCERNKGICTFKVKA